MYRHRKFEFVSSIFVLAHLPCTWAFRVPLLSEELGCSPTLSIVLSTLTPAPAVQKKSDSLYYFDPFKLGTDTHFPRYREAEYKHGRVAMLAMSQILAIPMIKRFNFLPDVWSTNTDMTSFKVLPPDHAIAANMLQLKFQDIFPVLITCGVLEVFILVQQDATDMPGDYGIGYFGLRNKGLHEQELIMELEHGRLAMIGLVLYMLIDTTTSSYQEMSWLDQWIRFFGSIALAH